jgi:anaerobic magnesium-protoporphyrin IX monomethyl ester cyclase
MRVLLVNPPSAGVFAAFGMSLPPMGILYLAASLEQAGHEAIVVDLQVEQRHRFTDEVRRADLVGISSDTTRIEKALALARVAAAQGKPVVMGGPHPQFVAEEVLAERTVTAIVRGEGEHTLVALAGCLERRDELGSVAGIIYHDGERLAITPDGPLPEVAKLPLPARHLVDLRAYRASVADRPCTPLVTSRGCPSRCSFCSSASFFGVGWRARSPESILAELEVVYTRFGYRAVAFTDDNFTLDPRRTIAIADGIQERGWDLRWWNFSRVDSIVRYPEMVAAMARAGSAMVYLGIESGSTETLDQLGKNSRTGDAASAVKLLAEHGIESYGSYIIGSLNEGRKDIEQTIETARTLDTNIAQFSILTPYPGTPLYEKMAGLITTRRWKRYDGIHLVFRHPRINYHLLHFLLIKAYVRFYRRSERARSGFAAASRRQGVSIRTVAAGIREIFF